MNLRTTLIFLVLGFIALLIVMGAVSFVRWLKSSSHRSFRAMLVVLRLMLVGAEKHNGPVAGLLAFS